MTLRELVFDTETTGLHPLSGDRIIEIGCVELIDRKPTGREFHSYCCPDGAMIEADALECHGIAPETLIDAPRFAEIAPALLAFLGDAPIVAHRAAFDRNFVNAELERAGLPVIPPERWICTKLLASEARPTWANSLDVLCRRFGVDLSCRERHGALIDARLLAELYPRLLAAFEPKPEVPISGIELRPDGRVFVRVGKPGNWLETLREPGRLDAAGIQQIAAGAGLEI
jgi:DNA polymerase-3 subunit epsilon